MKYESDHSPGPGPCPSVEEADVVPTFVVDMDLCALQLSRVRCELQVDLILAEYKLAGRIRRG